jgi:hypothetical protein
MNSERHTNNNKNKNNNIYVPKTGASSRSKIQMEFSILVHCAMIAKTNPRKCCGVIEFARGGIIFHLAISVVRPA